MSTNDSNERDLQRRTVLGGIAGLGMLSLPASYGALEGSAASVPDSYEPNVDRSRHPGHPRFVEVGERLTNPVFVGEINTGEGSGVYGSRDNLAPGASPNPNPENYDATDFEWALTDRPDGSTAELTFTSPSEEYGEPRYDEGRENVAEFEADVPGRYRLTLQDDAGQTHELTIHAFPAGDGPRPRIELEGQFQRASETDGVAEDRFVVESNAALAPDSQQTMDDLEVVFLADDRDPLSTADITVEDGTAVIPKAALGGETARVHAAAHDGQARSMMDTIELDPTAESVSLPNRPPEWIKDSVVYQIFTRSWAGERFQTDFDVLINGDEGLGAQGLDYLADLGIDAVWLTPIVPSVSSFMHRTEKADATGRERGHYVGGGPHGYDATDYFDVAPDLVFGDYSPHEAYQRFVEECHKRDIKVIFDTVINHAGRFHDYFQDTTGGSNGNVHDLWWFFPQVTEWNQTSKYFDWFDRVENPRLADGHPKFEDGTVLEPSPRATGFFGLPVMPNWNYDNLALREHILACIDFWTGEIGVDGLRCDIAWGVPHSFWKEAREVARTNNGDVLLFDETIPNEPTFTENEFDMHYDKVSFTDTAVHIAEGQGEASGFLGAMESRTNDGFPDHTLFYNAIENHDEKRILDAALENYDDPAYASKLQRACWAAGVTLPGVPAIYYGQEREISKYGVNRHMGADDPRDGDVSPGDMRRAFMNWGDEFDGQHLEFYRTLIDVYHQYDVLQTDANVADDRYDAGNNHVLVFGRDASDLAGVTGPEKVLVAINYEPEPVQIDLRDAVDNVDLVTGNAIDVARGDGTMTVEVDTVAVLETPDFEPTTELLAVWPDQSGDDVGPGWYEYPTAADFSDGAFDLENFEIRDAGSTYQFVLEVGNLENVWDGPNGFSLQFPQIYVHDPASDVTGSSETIRDGVNLTFEKPYHYQIMGTGDWGGWIDPADGSDGESITVSGDETTDEIVFEVPQTAFDASFENLEFAPVLLGFDGDGPGGARPVTADGGEWQFEDTEYGTEADGTRHNVIDAATPADVDSSTTLEYTTDQRATVPFVDVQEGKRNVIFRGERISHHYVGQGTDVGPGNYTYPKASDIPEGSLDLEYVDVYESEEYYTIAYHMVNEFHDPWNGDPGFSLPQLQVYLSDPAADVPGSTEGRTGTNVTFEHEYHYALEATRDYTLFETATGETVGELHLESYEPENAIVLRFAKDDLEGALTEMGIAPLVFGDDDHNVSNGRIREVHEKAGQWVFGGAENENAPAVIDMATPSGVSRAEALAYDETSRAEIPFTWLQTYDTVRQAIVGDGPLEKAHVRSARDYWASGEPVPQTDREFVSYETVREWARELGE